MTNADPIYPQYEKAKNIITRCESISMAAHFIGCLHKAHAGGIEVLKTHQPWHILLALKWTFQEMDQASGRRPPAQLSDAHQVLNVLSLSFGERILPEHSGI